MRIPAAMLSASFDTPVRYGSSRMRTPSAVSTRSALAAGAGGPDDPVAARRRRAPIRGVRPDHDVAPPLQVGQVGDAGEVVNLVQRYPVLPAPS
jgi:hypothetical protein